MGYGLNPSDSGCYEGTTCLINKFDIRDEKQLKEVEEGITLAKAMLLEQEPIHGSFDFDHFKAIHRFLFCDLYDWAGEIRTVNISKKRTNFTDHNEIERIGTATLNKIKHGCLDNLDFNTFAEKIAVLYHEINILHPFREGNGRTERTFFTQLIRQYGYDINFAEVDTDLLMIATIQAAQGVMDYLISFFREAIEEPEQSIDFSM